MNDDRLKEILDRASRAEPLDDDLAQGIEDWSAIEAGTLRFDDASDAGLERLAETEGIRSANLALFGDRAEVDTALQDDPKAETEGGQGGKIHQGPWGLLSAAAIAIASVGAAILYFGPGGEGGGSVAWPDDAVLAELSGESEVSPPSLVSDGDLNWSTRFRGLHSDAVEGLLRRSVIVRTPLGFGSGVRLDDRWVLTAAQVVEDACDRAAWNGEPARVEVVPVEFDAEGNALEGPGVTSTVHWRRRDGTALLDVGQLTGDVSPLDRVELSDFPADVEVIGSTGAAATPHTLTTAGRAREGVPALGDGPDRIRVSGLQAEVGTAGSGVYTVSPEGEVALVGILTASAGQNSILASRPLGAMNDVAEAREAPTLQPPDPLHLSLGETRTTRIVEAAAQSVLAVSAIDSTGSTARISFFFPWSESMDLTDARDARWQVRLDRNGSLAVTGPFDGSVVETRTRSGDTSLVWSVDETRPEPRAARFEVPDEVADVLEAVFAAK